MDNGIMAKYGDFVYKDVMNSNIKSFREDTGFESGEEVLNNKDLTIDSGVQYLDEHPPKKKRSPIKDKTEQTSTNGENLLNNLVKEPNQESSKCTFQGNPQFGEKGSRSNRFRSCPSMVKPMLKYSANYSLTNHNFVLQNIKDIRRKNNEFLPVICILKNILQRGCPTVMSEFLQSKLGKIHKEEGFRYKYRLIGSGIPIWYSTIKGDEKNNYFPAITFLEKIIPEFLPEYKFIQQLIVPEVEINEIVGVENDKFATNQVDFYLPQARLVIEIDGQQHKIRNAISQSDRERDIYLKNNKITTIRIDTIDIERRGSNLLRKINQIRAILSQNKKILMYQKQSTIPFESISNEKIINKLRATAIIRFQILLLVLLENGTLSLTDGQWKINILERDIGGFANLAIEDLFIWIENLCKLHKLTFNRPALVINSCHDSKLFLTTENYINIDFSLFNRWTDENELFLNVFFVRTDYFDDANYFSVSTTDPVQYKIINDGENSDIPALNFILKNIFGFSEFADGQLPIIINSLKGEDTIGLLPTGGGKSLCYQFVALLQPCVSFVVCPIKALMYDQKENLDKRFIDRTNFLTGDQTATEKARIGKEFSESKYLFVWISPERFQNPQFRTYLIELNQKFSISLAVIDEVHCLSEWGHDFRTSYLNLIKTINEYCPSARLLGLTATASVNVLKDITAEFGVGMENVKTILSFTRKELIFRVIHEKGDRKNKQQEVIKLLNKLNSDSKVLECSEGDTQSGLIFTIMKGGDLGCYHLAHELSNEFNTCVGWYSGKVPQINNQPVMTDYQFKKHKKKMQDGFKNNEFPLMVATKAFGMGIDKENIRYTVHFGIPGSMESLYQEAGRAGRDKKSALCYVIYSPEKMDKAEIDKLFALDTSVQEIKQIVDQKGYENGRDIMSNLFLWGQSLKGIDEEFELINLIYKKFASPGKVKDVIPKQLNYGKDEIEKAIYKLSLLGVVKDWVKTDWMKGFLEVTFEEYDYESMEKSLFEYIWKYNQEFSVLKNENDSQNKIYIGLYHDQTLEPYERLIKIILTWYYENIVYHRRQSLKHVVEICGNYTNEEEFKVNLEGYFTISETTSILDHIASNPDDYSKIFAVFYTGGKEQKQRLDKGKIEILKNNLSRFLESYRYNTGLNLMSGLVRLLLEDYNNLDGKPRFESALEQISKYPESDRHGIYDQILNIGQVMKSESQNILAEILIEQYYEGRYKIHNSLQDKYSLGIILEESNSRLKRIGEGLL